MEVDKTRDKVAENFLDNSIVSQYSKNNNSNQCFF